MTTQPQPGSAHLRAAKELNAAFNLYAWEDSEKECAAILAKHFPAPPALTGGDAGLAACLLAANPKGSDKERFMDAFIAKQAAARIAALSAQVAELSKQVDNWREIHEIIVRTEETRLARIAELERDKARMCDALELARQNLPDRLIFHIDAAMNPKQP